MIAHLRLLIVHWSLLVAKLVMLVAHWSMGLQKVHLRMLIMCHIWLFLVIGGRLVSHLRSVDLLSRSQVRLHVTRIHLLRLSVTCGGSGRRGHRETME